VNKTVRDVLAGYVERGEVCGAVGLVARGDEVEVTCAGAERDAILRISSTVDDYLAFSRMMLGHGPRVLSRASRELMTQDHLTPAQKAASSFMGYFDANGWGFGMGVVTRRDDVLNVGTFGWDGGLGSTWRADRAVGDVTTVLLTTQTWSSPNPPPIAPSSASARRWKDAGRRASVRDMTQPCKRPASRSSSASRRVAAPRARPATPPARRRTAPPPTPPRPTRRRRPGRACTSSCSRTPTRCTRCSTRGASSTP
jgi:hypothetical protein